MSAARLGRVRAISYRERGAFAGGQRQRTVGCGIGWQSRRCDKLRIEAIVIKIEVKLIRAVALVDAERTGLMPAKRIERRMDGIIN